MKGFYGIWCFHTGFGMPSKSIQTIMISGVQGETVIIDGLLEMIVPSTDAHVAPPFERSITFPQQRWTAWLRWFGGEFYSLRICRASAFHALSLGRYIPRISITKISKNACVNSGRNSSLEHVPNSAAPETVPVVVGIWNWLSQPVKSPLQCDLCDYILLRVDCDKNSFLLWDSNNWDPNLENLNGPY